MKAVALALLVALSASAAVEVNTVLHWNGLQQRFYPLARELTNGFTGTLGADVYYNYGNSNRFYVGPRNTSLEFPCSLSWSNNIITGAGTNVLVGDWFFGGTSNFTALVFNAYNYDWAKNGVLTNLVVAGFIRMSLTNSVTGISETYFDFLVTKFQNHSSVFDAYIQRSGGATNITVLAHAINYGSSSSRLNGQSVGNGRWLYFVMSSCVVDGWERIKIYDVADGYRYIGETYSAITAPPGNFYETTYFYVGYLNDLYGTVEYGPMAFKWNYTATDLTGMLPQTNNAPVATPNAHLKAAVLRVGNVVRR